MTVLDDGCGNTWKTCGADCGLQIVRPGEVACHRADCPEELCEQ